jgi:AraC-like DNA-binding protein
MRVQPEALLSSFRVLRRGGVREFHAYITGMEGRHTRRVDVPDEPGLIELRHASLGQVEVGLQRSAVHSTVEAQRGSGDAYLLQFPLDCRVELAVNGHPCLARPGDAIVLSPTQHVQRSAGPGWTLVFRIAGPLLRTQLATRSGVSPTGPLVFQPILEDSEELLAFSLLIVEALDRGAARRGNRIARLLEEGLVDLLLDLQPHTHASGRLGRQLSARAERIRRVSEYLDAHPEETLRAGKLARVAGCSLRALQATFSQMCGLRLGDYVRRHRLARARTLLENAQAGSTVSALAAQAGFSHMARFAQAYKARYGESPSQTLRRVTAAPRDRSAPTRRN